LTVIDIIVITVIIIVVIVRNFIILIPFINSSRGTARKVQLEIVYRLQR